MALLSPSKKDKVENDTDLRKILDACTEFANRAQWCSSYDENMNRGLQGTKYYVGYNNKGQRRIMVNENVINPNEDLQKVVTSIAAVAANHGYKSHLKRAIENVKDELSVDINFEQVRTIRATLPSLSIKPTDGEITSRKDNWGDEYTGFSDELLEKMNKGSSEDVLRFLLERGVTFDPTQINLSVDATEEVTVVPKG
jgi:hypothetical protein